MAAASQEPAGSAAVKSQPEWAPGFAANGSLQDPGTPGKWPAAQLAMTGKQAPQSE